jgi:chromosome segregation ATPase
MSGPVYITNIYHSPYPGTASVVVHVRPTVQVRPAVQAATTVQVPNKEIESLKRIKDSLTSQLAHEKAEKDKLLGYIEKSIAERRSWLSALETTQKKVQSLEAELLRRHQEPIHQSKDDNKFEQAKVIISKKLHPNNFPASTQRKSGYGKRSLKKYGLRLSESVRRKLGRLPWSSDLSGI